MDSEVFAYSIEKRHYKSVPSYVTEKNRLTNSQCAKVLIDIFQI